MTYRSRHESTSKTDVSDDNEEVTEETVCVEFGAAIDSQLFNSNHNSIKFFGLDTNQVMLQMSGNTFFSGQMEHIFGTNVLFEAKQSQKPSDKDADVADDHKSLHYIGKCDKKLVMKRVFIEPKQTNEGSDQEINE